MPKQAKTTIRAVSYTHLSDGELDCADYQIQDITELPSILEKLK